MKSREQNHSETDIVVSSIDDHFVKKKIHLKKFNRLLRRRRDIQHNDTQHKDIEHNDTQHKELISDTQHERHLA